jgi:chromate transport protein ChrA
LNLTEKQLKNISWALAIISVVGNLLVNFKSVWGMVIWLIGSLGWVWYGRIRKENALMFLYVIYSLLNVMGIIMWSN